jgi:hypothetical protein
MVKIVTNSSVMKETRVVKAETGKRHVNECHQLVMLEQTNISCHQNYILLDVILKTHENDLEIRVSLPYLSTG